MSRRPRAARTPAGSPRRYSKGSIVAMQLGVIVVFLAAWQFLPGHAPFNRIKWMDPYFISSPKDVAQELYNLATGHDDEVVIWPYLKATLVAAIEGTLIGTVLGALSGLVLSNYETTRRVFTPFVHVANAVPRVALIPIIVIIVGPTETSAVITAVLVVYFVIFFNALEGGRTVPAETIRNVQIFGASNRQVMWDVRSRYVLAWTFAAFPNAVSFGLVSVVTAEILTGANGVGKLLVTAVSQAQATLTFGIVTVLGISGVILIYGTEALRRRLLRWWDFDR